MSYGGNRLKKFAWLVLALLLFVITGCTENTPEEEGEKPLEEQNIKNTIVDKAKVNEQFNRVLVDLLENYDFMYNNHYYYKFEFQNGVIYADLIDFDQNGQDELYVIFQSGGYTEDAYSHRQFQGYIHEVWHATSGEEAELIHHASVPIENCFGCGTNISFHEWENGQIALSEKIDYHDESDESAIFTHHFYELENGEFKVNTFETDTREPIKYSLNGKEYATSDEFFEERDHYSRNERMILYNDTGIQMFEIDISRSGLQISKLLRQLNATNNTLASYATKIDPYDIQAEAEYMMELPQVDVLNTATHSDLLKYLFYKKYMDWNLSGYSAELGIFDSYPEEVVSASFEQVFGVPLDLSNIETAVDLEEGDYENYYYKIIYKDGYISYTDPSDHFTDYWRTVTKAYEIADNKYYVEMLDAQFYFYYYTEKDYHYYYDYSLEDYLHEPYENWPDPLLDFTKTDMQRYAIIKIVDGYPAFLYIGYDNLTDDEIAAYLDL